MMIELTEDQASALGGMQRWADEWDIAALSGVAGSGKTVVIGELLRGMDGLNRVAVCCPTWKALSVVKRVDFVEYMTVHSLLGLRLKQQHDGSQVCVPEGTSRLHQFDLVVVDEASMIGPDLYELLVDPDVRHGCAVLFVGDPMQLPPVGNGSRRELSPVFSNVQHQWRLEKVVRQARGNPIIEASIWVRGAIELGERVKIEELQAGLFGAVAGVMRGGAEAIVTQAVAALGRSEDVRVLCYRNKAVEWYNAAIHEAVYGVGAAQFEPGERVVMQDSWEIAGRRNRVLRNAEELIVSGWDEDAGMLELEGVGKPIPVAADRAAHDCEVSRLFAEYRRHKKDQNGSAASDASRAAWRLRNSVANVRHGYASTLHKSQGSTYDTVLIDWRDASWIRDAAEFSRAMYVGITRTREKLVVVVV